MREIKYRQPLFYKGKFNMWHHWGFVNGKKHGFTSPQNHQSENYQFTGLKDKNGVEIYESDIVSIIAGWDDGIKFEMFGVVEFDEFEYSVLTNDYHWPVISWKCVDFVEVIGNIYETPELLEAS
jgi:uncharacterized phage protein (TIGR01671 family)